MSRYRVNLIGVDEKVETIESGWIALEMIWGNREWDLVLAKINRRMFGLVIIEMREY